MEQRHERDTLVSARASGAAGDVQTMAAPAQGRKPLRVVSGLLRRSAGVGRRGCKTGSTLQSLSIKFVGSCDVSGRWQ